MEKKPYYISTAIAYTSAKPHIGNTYEIVLADAKGQMTGGVLKCYYISESLR